MPQLPLSLRSAFLCQPISGNEGQGQQHYQVTVAQNGTFQTLGLDPPHVLPGSLLSHTPQILLVTMSGLPTSPIYFDTAYFSAPLSPKSPPTP